jgi:hypothetical protein
MVASSVRSKLAAAVRRVNQLYRELPEEIRPDIQWSAADDALEDALKADSHRRALAAIREWEAHWRSIFREVSR